MVQRLKTINTSDDSLDVSVAVDVEELEDEEFDVNNIVSFKQKLKILSRMLQIFILNIKVMFDLYRNFH